jgi:hypothetical protein
MPFAAKNIEIAFPVAQAATATDTLFPMSQDDFACFQAQARLHPIYEANARSFLDLFAVNYKTNVPNFFISASDVFWGLGSESKLVPGLKITDAIWGEVEKVKKRAMKSERRIA